MRDGNQALIDPMDAARKLRFFEQLVAVGLKEIEVAFPSASDTDFNFVRKLIEERRIPADVTIEVLTQSRPDLIARTFESLRGAPRAIVHLYNPIAPQWRRIVLGMSRAEIKEIALAGTRQIRALADAHQETTWIYQYSPETFSLAELDFALEVCDAVSAIWRPTPARKMIINLPSPVECTSANVYADPVSYTHLDVYKRQLLGNPKVMLIDEPTEGLAPKIVEVIADVIRDIHQRGVSVVLVEQKLTIALKVSTRVSVMGHGRIVFEGPPAQLHERQDVVQEWLAV